MRFQISLLLGLCLSFLLGFAAKAEPLKLKFRSRHETAAQSGRWHAITQSKEWEAKETAIVVCDMWDTRRQRIARRRS